MQLRNIDPWHILLIISLVPVLMPSTISFWIAQNAPFIPRSWSEGAIDILTWIGIAVLAATGFTVYLLCSDKAHIFIASITVFGFILTKILLYGAARLFFGESDE